MCREFAKVWQILNSHVFAKGVHVKRVAILTKLVKSLEFKLVGQGAPLKVASPLGAFLVNQKGVGAATTNFYRFSSLE